MDLRVVRVVSLLSFFYLSVFLSFFEYDLDLIYKLALAPP